MSKFVLTAQLQLQAPTNSAQIIAQLRRDLSGLNAPITVTGAAKAKRQIKGVTAATNQAASSAQNMGKSFGLAFKRFAAFTIASRAVSLFTNGLANAVDEAIDFQREMIKISQVTGKTITQLQGLERTIFHLATSLGVSSKELLSTTRVLSQAGIKAKDLDVALAALAKTTLAPTFENIAQTAEGAIAILAQFKQGVGALETQLGSINAVAGQFAVESADIIGAIRRTGGVFKEAGGSLTEFIALFTSVRATTRESSESIATGLRTIFTRIQRPKTLEFLRQYGVELTDLEGRFVGPYEAVRRLNKAIGSLEQGDITFIKIAEEIAGFRQIGKVIPLLKEFELSERAKNAAVEGGNSLAEDAAKAQKSLAVQITKVKQEFQELIQGIANSTTFQAFVKTSLDLASALIKVADAIKPLIPLIAGLMAFKLARGLGGFASGVGGALQGAARKNQGGKILAFARGGMVPGQGNRDTVPAMLQPGEFVMRKSSVNKMGAGNLAAMNSQKFARGGLVVDQLDSDKFAGLFAKPKGKDSSGKLLAIPPKQGAEGSSPLATTGAPKSYFIGGADEEAFNKKAKTLLEGGINELVTDLAPRSANKAHDNILTDIGVSDIAGKVFEGVSRTIIGDFRKGGGPQQGFDIPKPGKKSSILTELSNLFNKGTLMPNIDYDNKLTEHRGNRVSLLEKAIADGLYKKDKELYIAKFDGGGKHLSTKQITQQQATTKNKGLAEVRIAELKGARKKIESMGLDAETVKVINKRLTIDIAKLGKYTNHRHTPTVRKAKPKMAASGGAISGSDTVPALLTPGEFVLNKSASKSIGYGNLGRMNKSGVAGFNKGGAVGVQRFAEGGGVGAGTAIVALTVLSMVNTKLQELGKKADGTRNAFGRVTDVLASWTMSAVAVVAALKYMGVTLTASKVLAFFGTGSGSLGSIISGPLMKNLKGFALGLGAMKTVGAPIAMTSASAGNVGVLAAQQAALATSGGKLGTSIKALIPIKVLEAAASLKVIAAKKLEALGSSKFGKSVKRGMSNFMQGTRGKAGRNKLGRFERTPMTKLGRAARGPMRLAQSVLPFGGGSAAAGAAGGAGAAAAGGGLAASGAAIATIAGPALAAVVALKLLSSVVGALVDVEGKKKDAILAGNEAEAGRLAAMQNFDGWLSGGLQQGILSLGYAMASASGAVTDFATWVVTMGGGTEDAGATLEYAFTRVSELVAGDYYGSLRQIGIAQAAAADAALKYADNTRKASRALEDIKSGRVSASEGFGDTALNLKKQGDVKAKAQYAEAVQGEKSHGISAGIRNVMSVWTTLGSFGMSGMEFAGTKNERINVAKTQSAEEVKKFAQDFDKMRPSFKALGKEMVLSGGTVEDFKKRMEDEGIMGEGGYATEEQQESMVEDFKRQQEAIKANIAYIQALNFGLRGVTAAANAAAVSMDTVAAAGQAGFNSFEDSAKILEASVTAAGANIGDATMDSAIEDLEGSMRKFGASDKEVEKTTGTVRGLRTAQGNADAALKATQEKLTLGQDTSPKAIKDTLKGELLKGVEGPAKEKLASAIDNMKIDEEMRLAIKAGNLDKILEKTLDPVAKAASEQALSLLKKRAELENKLITSIKNRQKQEEEYIAAQKGAIETQLEAGKLFESFGGAKLTSGDKLGARVGQANLDLKNAGIGGLGGGSAREIKTALADIRSSSASQNDRANAAVMGKARGLNVPGAFEGAQGVDDDKRDELKAANKSLVTFTKQRITLIQEELNIARQKNKAEKDSLDKLLGGDIEGFLEGQLAAAAGTALKMGDAGAASSLGAGALGAGFKTLEGQGLSDRVMQNAASLSLSSVGVTDPRAAEVMAGTTAEEESLKSEGRELSQILGDAAQQGADLEQMDVNATNVVINASKIAMNQSEVPGGFYKGGPVYANRGMFVSRGTDTVPAMLTPGEFVVNRASVSAGNNLSILRSMNGGAGGMSGMGMSRGGMAYMAGGGLMGKVSAMMVKMATLGTVDLNKSDAGDALQDFENAGNAIKENIIDPMKKILNDPTGLKGVFNQFDQSVQKLIDFQLHVKVDPTNVTVNFQGSSFLAGLKDDIRNELIEKVREELKGAKFNESGDLESKPGGMP